ncbi:hypothetical protein B005_5420 [Nocardiopsis alba ATCC BAA-2165]|uniref:Uncharacterized protein n=1 Tax=Nocardiopsis alba (strain ATCC BAA-2165 / BE74) TaxID=1205910 RepID=J7LJD5_NOCAA|nr:hypothetical protein B005_5420 [Nocardiopsis alba ATCC BAA-2165]
MVLVGRSVSSGGAQAVLLVEAGGPPGYGRGPVDARDRASSTTVART